MKTLATLAVMAAAPLAMGENQTLLNQDFTSTTLTSLQTLTDAGWSVKGWQYAVDNNAVTINASGMRVNGWHQGGFSKALSIDLSKPTNTYVVDYVLTGTGNTNYNNVLVLSGATGSLAFGHSYSGDTSFHTGVTAANAFEASSQVNFASSGGTATELASDSSSGTCPGLTSVVTYHIELQGTSMHVTISGSDGNVLTSAYTLGSDYQNFNTIGVVLDSANGYATSLKVTGNVLVPEPATATLSLLVLAGLAARRRRK